MEFFYLHLQWIHSGPVRPHSNRSKCWQIKHDSACPWRYFAAIFKWLSGCALNQNFVCSRKQPKTFAFDHCFCSVDPNRENFASQEVVFDCLGRDILDNAFQGYNACIFAYGQTGKNFFNRSLSKLGNLKVIHRAIIHPSILKRQSQSVNIFK